MSDETPALLSGFILRGNVDGEMKYLSSGLYWFSIDLEGAWVHQSIPGDVNWKIEPDEWARAVYRPGDGVRRVGPWIPWSEWSERDTQQAEET